jgi:hypothetical protein
VGIDPVGGCGFGGFGLEEAGGCGAGRHWVSLPDGVVCGHARVCGWEEESGSRFARMPTIGAKCVPKMGRPAFGFHAHLFSVAGSIEVLVSS